MPYYWLSEKLTFPDPKRSGKDGIVALGGDLSVERLLLAYSNGIFPWYSDTEPIIWWSPDPRFVLFPNDLKVSKSMRQVFHRQIFEVTFDRAFRQVIQNCQKINRPGQDGTWITQDMLEAFCALHRLGYAHSVEVWQVGELVGGLYGVALGRCFFGESMFAKVSNASKTGFITLVKALAARGYELVDCQMPTDHLASLGATYLSRKDFLTFLENNKKYPTEQKKWTGYADGLPAV